ncbi:hypothetical protein GGR58DRAFT_510109 [Xylaria digitata]|nr:hypothetical protein GGR58DRAFT_510109 [Xylaria digitata]
MTNCNQLFNITSQADILQGPLSNCSGVDTINIEGETDRTLTFQHLTGVTTIIVLTTPQLEVLEFPHLGDTQFIRIDRATALTTISLPLISADSLTLWITGALSLTSLTIGNSTSFASLILSDVASSAWPLSPGFASPNISTTGSISLDACLKLDGLKSAKSLSISWPSFCPYNLTNLLSVGGFTLENAAFINTVDPIDSNNEPTTPVQITESMSLQNSFVDDNSLMGGTEIPLRRIGTITQDLNITSNGNVHIAYDGLTDVGGSLYIRDNWNCSINFDNLSMVGNIFFTNNTNTGLPLFPNLTTVGDIYISGFVGTSNGPNIFPALELVSGNVTIEAPNDAFDCSKLVSQLNYKKIHNLNCNGRNYSIDASTSGSGSGSGSGPGNGSGNTPGNVSSLNLSKGVWAGIGVGAGAIVLGILGAFIWVIMHYRSRVRKLEEEKEAAIRASNEKPSTEEPRLPQLFQTQEVDGGGIFREKPDDPLVEMPVYPTELPLRPQSWARSEAGVISWAR